jgi:hypothetical protein
MGTRLALSVLCLAGLCNGCASSGVIRGTLSARAGAEPTLSNQERNAGPASARCSLADAVIYVEGLRPGVESRLPAAPAPSRLEVIGQVLRPRVLVVPVGTSVEFLNQDSLFHNLFSVSPAKPFDLGRCGRGESKRVTFDKPGLVNVYCNLHSNWRRTSSSCRTGRSHGPIPRVGSCSPRYPRDGTSCAYGTRTFRRSVAMSPSRAVNEQSSL